ncbi:MAG: retropepsin-like domain-containing protein [Rubrobacter sp.]|nr:retropepsin-like domain-containing protein [Rubrobacter sp.]
MRTVWTRIRKTSDAPVSRPPLYVILLLFLSLALAWILYRERTTEVQANDSLILGKEELVELSARESGETREVLAKIDTGAGYSSIDEDLAEDLGIDLDNPEDEVEIESANGEEERPLVRVRIRLAGRTLDTRVTVADRSKLSKDVLIGSRDLDGFLIKPNEERLTSPDGPRS